MPDRRDPRIVGHLEEAVLLFLLGFSAGTDEPAHIGVMNPVVGVRIHRAELADHERLHHLTDPHLAKDDRPPGRQLHESRNGQKQR